MSEPASAPAADQRITRALIRSGDSALIGILVSDFFVAFAGTMVYLTMVWWVLAQGASELGVTFLVLSIFVPLNAGVIVSGVAVAKYGARRLLLVSKSLALIGAAMCYALLITDAMTLWSLALLAIFVYGSMGPSTTADVSRAPAIVRLARRRLASFNAANGIVTVLGSVVGLLLGGHLSNTSGSATALAISILLLLLSLSVTFAFFPRDRILPNHSSSNRQHLMMLSRKVIDRLDSKHIGIGSILITIGLITVAEGFSEVVLPIALRASTLPPTALSNALAISVIVSIATYVLAQYLHGKVALDITLAISGVVLCAILGGSIYLGGWNAVVLAMVATTAVASGTAMLAFTSIQLRMPASLQAQAAGLWHSVVLSASAAVIFLTGLMKSYGIGFLTFIAVVSSIAAAVHLGGRFRNSYK